MSINPFETFTSDMDNVVVLQNTGGGEREIQMIWKDTTPIMHHAAFERIVRTYYRQYHFYGLTLQSKLIIAIFSALPGIGSPRSVETSSPLLVPLHYRPVLK